MNHGRVRRRGFRPPEPEGQPDAQTLEREMVEALLPREFIDWYEESDFVASLEQVRERIVAFSEREPGAAAELFATFHVACGLKADEVHGEWAFGSFAGDLLVDWFRNEQRSGTDRDRLADELMRYAEIDEYGHCSVVGARLGAVLDGESAAAFGRRLRHAASGDDEHADGRRALRDALRARAVSSGDLDAFLEWTGNATLLDGGVRDLVALATDADRAKRALARLDQALADDSVPGMFRTHEAEHARRALLAAAGRSQEAFDLAREQFETSPCVATLAELLGYAPPEDHALWRERAAEFANVLPLGHAVGLLLHLDELLAFDTRLAAAEDDAVRGIEETQAVHAAGVLAEEFPASAARLYADLARRLLEARRSKQYDEAIRLLAACRDSLTRAGATDRWMALADDVMSRHRRQHKFRAMFEALLAGEPPPEPWNPVAAQERARADLLRRARARRDGHRTSS